MATTLRRSLYIGLGGTGINAILHTKKMFMEAYGEIPPMIGFLGIDTDKQAFEKKLDASINGRIEVIELEEFEKGKISVSDPSKTYEREKNGFLNWVPEKNVGFLRSLENGAGQIRTNGRIGLMINSDNIYTAIKNRITSIRDPKHQDDPRYEVVDNNKDEIHMIFSVCGGTGAGTFIDIAYLAKQAAGQIGGNHSAKIIGYALLPDVFKAMYPIGPAMKNVRVNAYGSIFDLDYLMHLDNTSNRVTFKLSKTNTIHTNETPFSSVVLVDNKNSRLITYTHVDHLTEMLSVTLFMAAGEFGNNGASVLDNIEAAKDVTKVKNKKSWVSYLGASEIIFKGSDIADVYAKRAVQSLIQKLLANNKDATNIANTWIDQTKIREHLSDDFIDSICSNNLRTSLEEIDPEKATEDIQNFYDLVIPNAAYFSGKESTLRSDILSKLEKFVQTNINDSNSPVISTLNALKDIKEQVKVFRTEMLNEEDQFEKSFPTLESQLKTSIKDLTKYHGRTLAKVFRPGKKTELQDFVREFVHKIAVNKIELKRRIVARNIYDSVLVELQKVVDRIEDIRIVMENVEITIREEIAKLQNYSLKKINLFDIDLGADFVTHITVRTEEIMLSDFINSLPGKNLYNISNQDALAKQMENYTRDLPQTKSFEGMTIDDRLSQLNENEFDKLLKDALAKANPLIDIDRQGFLEVNDSVAKQFFVGVYRRGISKLETTNTLRDNLEAITKVEFIPTGMKDRVVFYRLEGPLPPFAVSSIINSCEVEYQMYMDNANFICPNFDKNLLDTMIMEEHSLMPSDELNIAMKYWVMGFIFGYIKRRSGNYYYQDINKIGQGNELISLQTKKRTNAYIEFRKQIGKLRSMYDAYIEKAMRDDAPDVRKKVADANSIFEGRMKYFNEIADCEVNRSTINGAGYGSIRELIEQEEAFVKNYLLNTVESYL